MAENNATALEIVRAPQSDSTYEPRNFDEALRLATCYASSALLGEIRSPEAALLIMAVGRELGISSTAALRGIYVIKGKPVLSSDLLVAVVLKRSDLCEYFICTASDETSATYETKRKGRAEPIRNTFSMADAQRAQLCASGGNWQKYPRNMLRHRAASELARMVYPDITLGLYTESEADELRDVIDVTPPTPLTSHTHEPVRTAEPESESTATAIARWKAGLVAAATTADADRIAREMRGRLTKGTQEHTAMVALYKERVKALRSAHVEQPVAPAASQPQDADIVVEREPGADDADG